MEGSHLLDGAVSADYRFESNGPREVLITGFLRIDRLRFVDWSGNRPPGELTNAQRFGGVKRLERSYVHIAKNAGDLDKIADGDDRIVGHVHKLRGEEKLGTLHGISKSLLQGSKRAACGSYKRAG